MFGMSRKPPAIPVASDKPKAKSKATPDSGDRFALTVQLTAIQRDKLDRLGGEDWLREQIEKALLPRS